MHEITINLHMHTLYSDGTGLHTDLAKAAIKAGLDAMIVTDHNIWVQGVEGYHGEDDQKVLMLIGEEVHDQARDPQKNHLLVFGAESELATLCPRSAESDQPGEGSRGDLLPGPPGRPASAKIRPGRPLLGQLGCERVYRNRAVELDDRVQIAADRLSAGDPLCVQF